MQRKLSGPFLRSDSSTFSWRQTLFLLVVFPSRAFIVSYFHIVDPSPLSALGPTFSVFRRYFISRNPKGEENNRCNRREFLRSECVRFLLANWV